MPLIAINTQMAQKRTKFITDAAPLPDAGPRAARVRRRLLAWYDKHQRSMPWRAIKGQTPNPYHVLVSEAMLQQTQVATVVAYFDRFVEALPTVGDLANAKEQQVLRLWQGLGYYRRARNLHAAARVIVQDHGGMVPDTVEALLKLPGVGRYTAGAIASIAYNQPAPILDGNVARVFARLFLIEQPIDDAQTRNTLWRLSEDLVPKKRPGDFNQSVMELGALVCTKANPSCDTCPLSGECDARQSGRVSEVPVPTKRKAPVAVHHHIFAVERNGRFLFQQRPATGLWSNMWQMPTVEDWSAKVEGKTIKQWMHDQLSLETTSPMLIDAFKHQTTHRTIRLHIWHMKATSGRLRPGSGKWRRLNQLDDLPLSNPQRQAVQMLIG